MGLFDKFKTEKAEIAFNPQSEQEAWVGILYACAAIDGNISDEERDNITKTVVYKTLFSGYDILAPYKKAFTCWQVIGSKAIIDECAPLIKEESKGTLFCCVIETLLTGGLQDDEKEIIEYLQNALALNTITAEKIIEVMLIRNKWDTVIQD